MMIPDRQETRRRMKHCVRACSFGLTLALLAGAAHAAGSPPLPLPRPGMPAAPSPFSDVLRMANGFAPFSREAPLELPDLTLPRASALTLTARLSEASNPLSKGVRWRVYSTELDAADPAALPELLHETREASPAFDLAPGAYIVNVRFGAVSETRRVMVGLTPGVEDFPLDAGALRITSLLGPSEPAPESQVRIDIFERDPDIDPASRVISGAAPGDVVRLKAGNYHVVSRYGDGNAFRRSQVRVEPGRLTDAHITHQAAEISFKLVTQAGGEAVAGTSWTVLTPGGDTVLSADGAYAGQVLAAGEYIVVARNGEAEFNRTFEVESGADTQIEVLVSR